MRAAESVLEPPDLSGTRCRSDDVGYAAALHRSPVAGRRSPKFFRARCRFERASRVV